MKTFFEEEKGRNKNAIRFNPGLARDSQKNCYSHQAWRLRAEGYTPLQHIQVGKRTVTFERKNATTSLKQSFGQNCGNFFQVCICA